MNLFSQEAKKEFEKVGVDVSAIERLLPTDYHSIFKELIEGILSDKRFAKKVKNKSNNSISKVDEVLLLIKSDYFKYYGLAQGLQKQYHYVKLEGFLSAYTSLDSHKGEWIPLNCNCSAMHKEMKGADRELYLSLPDKVTIYRGAHIDEYNNGDFGMSWTLNQKIAERFALDMPPVEDKKVFKVIVDKSSIVAYTNEREEEECIMNTDLDDVFYNAEIINTEL